MNNLLLVFAVFESVFSACSDKMTEATCSGDAACDWHPGSCDALTATQCSSTACATGCVVTPEVKGICTNPDDALNCGSKTNIQCSGQCSWDSSAHCENATSRVVCTYDHGICSSGCYGYSPAVCGYESGRRGESCSSLSTAETTTECAFMEDLTGGYCTVSGGNCIGDEECGAFSATRAISECLTSGMLICRVSGSSCIPHVDFMDDYYTSYCAGLSVSPSSECVLSSVCKKSGSACVDKTEEEICNQYSISECATQGVSSGRRCIVNGAQCSVDAFPCSWNTTVSWTQCDDESLSHGCQVTTGNYECRNQNCPAHSSSTQCTSNLDEGCVWSTLGRCKVTSPKTCVETNTGECTSYSVGAGCITTTAYSPSTCSLPTVVPSTCTARTSSEGCYEVSGCQWLSTTGGRCAEKEGLAECVSSLPEAVCKSGNCQWDAANGCSKKSSSSKSFPWWIIVVVVVVVLLIIAVIITLVVMKVKKAACFAPAKVGVINDSEANPGNTNNNSNAAAPLPAASTIDGYKSGTAAAPPPATVGEADAGNL